VWLGFICKRKGDICGGIAMLLTYVLLKLCLAETQAEFQQTFAETFSRCSETCFC
jgi:hypothetical protein